MYIKNPPHPILPDKHVRDCQKAIPVYESELVVDKAFWEKEACMSSKATPPILDRVLGLYRNQYKESETVRQYLESLAVDTEVLGSTQLLGFSVGDLYQYVKVDECVTQDLVEIGLLRDDNSEVLENHIVVPHFAVDKKEVVGFEGFNMETQEVVTVGDVQTPLAVTLLSKTTAKKEQSSVEESARDLFILKHIDKKSGKLLVTVKVENPTTKRFYINTLNLYVDKQRKQFVESVAKLLNRDIDDIEKLVFVWIRLLEEQPEIEESESRVEVNEQDEQLALVFLKSPKLFDTLLDDFKTLGYTGEELNKQLAYLVMTSRKTQNPLSLIIMSNSAAGKSTLQKTVLDLCPNEESKHFTRLTAQSLYYLGKESLKHKFLSIEESEGSHDASYALKILLSAKEIKVGTTSQDPSTGQRHTQEQKTEGPVSVIVSTTQAEVESELASRTLIVTIDETKEQTTSILESQRFARTLDSLLQGDKKKDVVRKHHAIQRLLKPVTIINNLAPGIQFPTDRIKYRRGQEQYLNLIDTIAFLRQFQKERKTHDKVGEYIEVDATDVELANVLFTHAFKWVVDDFKPATRKLLEQIQGFCKQNSTNLFTRMELRNTYKWDSATLHRHIRKLCELEVIRLARGKDRVKHYYELIVLDDVTEFPNFRVGIAKSVSEKV